MSNEREEYAVASFIYVNESENGYTYLSSSTNKNEDGSSTMIEIPFGHRLLGFPTPNGKTDFVLKIVPNEKFLAEVSDQEEEPAQAVTNLKKAKPLGKTFKKVANKG